jgi:hypothetical protein
VEDPDVAVVADEPVELPPGGQMLVIGRSGEPLEVLERAPVLDADQDTPGPRALDAEQSERRVGGELAKHPRHGPDGGEPGPGAPQPVDTHADDEDDDLVVEVGCVPTDEDLVHPGLSAG